jgi:hypothetical protein
MTQLSKRALFWTPRALSIVFIAFLSLFALDVFDEHLGLWRTVLALTMHLIPSLVLIAALVLVWRWEWIGAALYAAAGLLYVAWVVSMSRPVPVPMRLIWILTIAGPAFVIAGLFLANWLRRGQLRPPRALGRAAPLTATAGGAVSLRGRANRLQWPRQAAEAGRPTRPLRAMARPATRGTDLRHRRRTSRTAGAAR